MRFVDETEPQVELVGPIVHDLGIDQGVSRSPPTHPLEAVDDQCSSDSPALVFWCDSKAL